ncbi:hypothetical protein AHAS_Ahas19G0202500 [Arachis hypogaea]
MPQYKIPSQIHTIHFTNPRIHFTMHKPHFRIHKIHLATHKTHSIPPQNNFTTTPTYPQHHSQPSSLELAFKQFFQSVENHSRKIEGHLKKIRKHLGLLSKEDEDQFLGVKDEVEEQEKEATVSSETSMKKDVVEVYEPRIPYPQRLLR